MKLGLSWCFPCVLAWREPGVESLGLGFTLGIVERSLGWWSRRVEDEEDLMEEVEVVEREEVEGRGEECKAAWWQMEPEDRTR